MLSIERFREEPEKIKESEERREKDSEKVDRVVELDRKWRETLQKADDLRHERNVVSDKIAELKKEGRDAEEEIKRMKQVNQEIEDLEEKEKQLKEERDRVRYEVGNILHSSVPKGEDEEDNKEVRKYGEKPDKGFEVVPHADIVKQLDLADTEKAGEVTGSRFYYLKKDLVMLNLALQKWALEKLIEEGYTPMQTPYILGHEAMSAAAELEDFEDQLYKIEGEDWYLIATSEQTLASYHFDEILEPEDLPMKYTGLSTNFRQEAGSHGKDTKGIFRVHQFEKVEQYIFCKPEKSWDIFEDLMANVEELFQDLNLHYRIVNVCTGDMNDNAAKKYDLEAWFPAQDRYRELVSCSNCTSYQARKLKVRMRDQENDNPTVHTLNATGVATQRTMCAIMEQNQLEDGRIKIPEVLQDYMGGQEYIEPEEEEEEEKE
ncbi:MAG: serine--tRNA ligase [Candidatus Nanohaloarchaea archaeon]|nr:serine--tRNA ligase [Candidatus Nanohaloarchaea archaeon]